MPDADKSTPINIHQKLALYDAVFEEIPDMVKDVQSNFLLCKFGLQVEFVNNGRAALNQSLTHWLARVA